MRQKRKSENTEKIDKLQESQRVVKQHVDEVYNQSGVKVTVFEENVSATVSQLYVKTTKS